MAQVISRYSILSLLEYKALIITEPTKYESESGQVRNGNLLFTILPIQGAVNHYNESQPRR